MTPLSDESHRLSGDQWRAWGVAGARAGDGVVHDEVLGIPGLRATTEPLARLVSAAVAAHRGGRPGTGLVGLTGGVAAGKTTTAGALAAVLGDDHGLSSETLSTDGFLWPNAELERRGLTARKGYPETYDYQGLLAAVAALASGDRRVEVPVYDHLAYDVLAGQVMVVGAADVVIVEGLNVLQAPPSGDGGWVADRLDLGIYVDAAEADLRSWYHQRVTRLRAEATGDGSSFYDAFSALDDDAFSAVADQVWELVNLPNLVDHIEPSRDRADVVVVKASDHSVHEVRAASPRARTLLS